MIPGKSNITYQESSELMGDITFRGRVKVACLNFAAVIGQELTTTPAHATRVRWATNTLLNPDAAASQVTPGTVMHPTVQAQGSAVSDVDLQAAVEDTINQIM